jgi:hypothetical protein
MQRLREQKRRAEQGVERNHTRGEQTSQRAEFGANRCQRSFGSSFLRAIKKEGRRDVRLAPKQFIFLSVL